MATIHFFPQQADASIAHQLLGRHTRAEIENAIEILIDSLDAIDGDADAEDTDVDRCEAGDDGCGRVYLRGNWHYGSDDEEGEHEGWEQPVTLNPGGH